MHALLSKFNCQHLFLLLITLSHTDAANILAIIPFPSISYSIPFVPLFQSLSTQHNVTVITSNPNSIHPKSNVRTIDVSEVYDHELSTELIETITGYNIGKHHEVFRIVVQNPDVRALILDKDCTFDLVLTDITSPIWNVFGQRFDCPVIGLLPQDVYLVHMKMGTPTNPAVHADSAVGLSYDMNTLEKIYNILIGLLLVSNDFFYIQQKVNYYLEEYFPKDQDMETSSLEDKMAMLFVNQIPGFHKLRASTDNTKYIGSGPKYVEKYSINNYDSMIEKNLIVVYVEFNDETHIKLMEELENLDETVFWVKHPKYAPQESQNNIKVIEPYEFQDILQNHKVDLLITNGDNHHLEVSFQYTIPMLIILKENSGQEKQNAEKLKQDNIASVLQICDIEHLQGYIEDVIQRNEYVVQLCNLL